MRSLTLYGLVVASMVGQPTGERARLTESDYLPGVNHHLERARTALEQDQLEIATANTKILLHEQGLRVYVDTRQMPSEQAAGGSNASRRAIDYWNGVIGDSALTLVEVPQAADVTIQFHREVTLRGVQVGGYCSQSRSITIGGDGSASAHYQATIFARYQLPGGKLLSEDLLMNVVAHEIGHVFGLNDCREPGHLMSPLHPSRPKFELEPDELESLRRLRSALFEMQRDISAKRTQAKL